jgi:hypothetical protein
VEIAKKIETFSENLALSVVEAKRGSTRKKTEKVILT